MQPFSHNRAWTEEDLKLLMETRPRENGYLDYKEARPDIENKKHDFLTDVSAFANAGGGVILYGITDKDSKPDVARGVKVDSCDKLTGQLQAVIKSGLDPILYGCNFDYIQVEDGKYVVVLRIPESTSAPHRIDEGKPTFYTRGANLNLVMDTHQLRSAFLKSKDLAKDIRDFVYLRDLKIADRVNEYPLQDGGQAILHIIPLSAFIRPVEIPMYELKNAVESLKPPEGNDIEHVISLNGVAAVSKGSENRVTSYFHLFSNGSMEMSSPALKMAGAVRKLAESRLLNTLAYRLKSYVEAVTNLGFHGPWYISLSYINCENAIPENTERPCSPQRPIQESPFILPPMQWVESLVNCTAILKYFSDRYANYFGDMESLLFDENGNLISR